MLEDEVYLGHTINLKYTTLPYKNKKRVKRPESERIRIENTHEPLIDQSTWNIVQDIRRHKRRRANMAEQNIFSGFVYCKDCGGTMVLHRAHTMDAIKNNFMCSTYKKKGKENCSAHYIRESQLATILIDDLRRVPRFARQNELLFAKHITQKNGAEIRREIARVEREIEKAKRYTQIRELTAEILHLFIERVEVGERDEKWSHTAP
nr:recombinase zinc beta ribbon domain-containing protein [uncultured Oscillibacter sp.]